MNWTIVGCTIRIILIKNSKTNYRQKSVIKSEGLFLTGGWMRALSRNAGLRTLGCTCKWELIHFIGTKMHHSSCLFSVIDWLRNKIEKTQKKFLIPLYWKIVWPFLSYLNLESFRCTALARFSQASFWISYRMKFEQSQICIAFSGIQGWSLKYYLIKRLETVKESLTIMSVDNF